MRKSLRSVYHGFFPIVLLTGFFVAGINGGKACNTFPMVGNHYFVNSNHLNSDIPLWKNFTENKLIAQVNHRTLASFMTLLVTYKCVRLLTLPGLHRVSKFAAGLLLAAVWAQVAIGVTTIW